MMRIQEKIDHLIQVIENVIKGEKLIIMRVIILEDIMHDVDEYFVDRPHLLKSLNNNAENIYMLVVLNSLGCL